MTAPLATIGFDAGDFVWQNTCDVAYRRANFAILLAGGCGTIF